MEAEFDLGDIVLDDQIVDVEGRRCGRVDDIELVGEPGGPLRVDGLLTGRGVYPARLPQRLHRVARTLFGSDIRGKTVHRVPWSAIDDIGSTVRLRVKALELNLGWRDRDLKQEIEELPGA